ncbi:MAG: DUF4184 family protein [Anaerolineaceae bacterium]|nr:DUF4184 family protein [Anaerolineaceae bacterium]
MPFTLAHPAASIPLTRRGLLLSALVVGSLAPDFSYFVTLDTNQNFGHTLAGLFWFCLPMGLLVLWLFHGLVKRPLLALLPQGFQLRLAGATAQPFSFFPSERTWKIVLSLLVGSITHLVWDSFTHPDGWIVEHFQVFDTIVFRWAGSDFQIYTLLQYASSLVGMALIGWWVWRWYRQARVFSGTVIYPISTWQKWLITAGLFGLAFGLGGWLCWQHSPMVDSLTTFKQLSAQLFVTGTSFLCVEFSIFGVIWKGWVEHEPQRAS